MSTVAEGWHVPARRLLCRNRKIDSWEGMTDAAAEVMGKEVRNISLDCHSFKGLEAQTVARAFVKLIKNLPNLRTLRIRHIPFTSFNALDSQSLRTTAFLPLLSELSLHTSHFSHPVLSDLFATNNHQVSRFTTQANQSVDSMPQEEEPLDFGGNLRFLKATRSAYTMISASSRISFVGLRGLTELVIHDPEPISREREIELFSAVGPTLEKLTIRYCDPAFVKTCFPLLVRLTRLSLFCVEANPASVVLNLPPSVAFLKISSDNSLEDVFLRWKANPALVPIGLKHIYIGRFYDRTTLANLPKLDKFSTKYTQMLLSIL